MRKLEQSEVDLIKNYLNIESQIKSLKEQIEQLKSAMNYVEKDIESTLPSGEFVTIINNEAVKLVIEYSHPISIKVIDYAVSE